MGGEAESSGSGFYIYVGNIPKTATEDQLRKFFWECKGMVSFNFRLEDCTYCPTKIAFIRFSSRQDENKAYRLNQSFFQGKRIFVASVDSERNFTPRYSVVVKNLNEYIPEEDIYEHFKNIGVIECVQKPTNSYAYISFERSESVQRALMIKNRNLKGVDIEMLPVKRNICMLLEKPKGLPYASIKEKCEGIGLRYEEEAESETKLLVTNIPRQVPEDEILEYLGKFGKIVDWEMQKSPISVLTNIGYVTYMSPKTARYVYLYGPHYFQGVALDIYNPRITYGEVKSGTAVLLKRTNVYLTNDEIYQAMNECGRVSYIHRVDATKYCTIVRFHFYIAVSQAMKVKKIADENVYVTKYSELNYMADMAPIPEAMPKSQLRLNKEEMLRQIIDQEDRAEITRLRTIPNVTYASPNPEFYRNEVQVMNYPHSTGLSQFREYFKKCGNVINFREVVQGVAIKIGFISFDTRLEARRACSINQNFMNGKRLLVHMADEILYIDPELCVNVMGLTNNVSDEDIYDQFDEIGNVKFVFRESARKAIVCMEQKRRYDAALCVTAIGKYKVIVSPVNNMPSTPSSLNLQQNSTHQMMPGQMVGGQSQFGPAGSIPPHGLQPPVALKGYPRPNLRQIETMPFSSGSKNPMGSYGQLMGPRPAGPSSSVGAMMGPTGQIMGPNRERKGPNREMIGSNGSMMGPNGSMMGQNRPMMGPNGPMLGPNGPMMGPNISMMGPNRPLMGPNGPMVGPNGPMMGPTRGPNSSMMGPNGPMMGSNGPMIGPKGPMMGPNGPMMGPNGPTMGPNSSMMGPNGPMMGPNGRVMGPNGPMMGPNRPIMGPNGPTMGPNSSMMGPNGPMMGPNGPMMGPNGPLMGPNGPMMGPNGAMRTNSQSGPVVTDAMRRLMQIIESQMINIQSFSSLPMIDQFHLVHGIVNQFINVPQFVDLNPDNKISFLISGQNGFGYANTFTLFTYPQQLQLLKLIQTDYMNTIKNGATPVMGPGSIVNSEQDNRNAANNSDDPPPWARKTANVTVPTTTSATKSATKPEPISAQDRFEKAEKMRKEIGTSQPEDMDEALSVSSSSDCIPPAPEPPQFSAAKPRSISPATLPARLGRLRSSSPELLHVNPTKSRSKSPLTLPSRLGRVRSRSPIARNRRSRSRSISRSPARLQRLSPISSALLSNSRYDRSLSKSPRRYKHDQSALRSRYRHESSRVKLRSRSPTPVIYYRSRHASPVRMSRQYERSRSRSLERRRIRIKRSQSIELRARSMSFSLSPSNSPHPRNRSPLWDAELNQPGRPMNVGSSPNAVFVSNLPLDASEDEVSGIFGKFGQILTIKISSHHNQTTKRAVMNFDTYDQALKALDMHLRQYRGHLLRVAFINKRQKERPGFAVNVTVGGPYDEIAVYETFKMCGDIACLWTRYYVKKPYCVIDFKHHDAVKAALETHKLLNGNKCKVSPIM